MRRGRGNRDWPAASLSRRLASLVLGCDWTLWHWPQFFMQDSYIAGAFPIGSAVFWVGWVLPTVLYTWIYNLTGRMILSAILLHFMVNFWGELLSVRGEVVVYRSVRTVVVVIAIVLIWGPKTLRGRRGGARPGDRPPTNHGASASPVVFLAQTNSARDESRPRHTRGAVANHGKLSAVTWIPVPEEEGSRRRYICAR